MSEQPFFVRKKRGRPPKSPPVAVAAVPLSAQQPIPTAEPVPLPISTKGEPVMEPKGEVVPKKFRQFGLVLGNGPSVDALPDADWARLFRLPAVGTNRCIVSAKLEAVRYNLISNFILDHPFEIEGWGNTPGFAAAWEAWKGRKISANHQTKATEYVVRRVVIPADPITRAPERIVKAHDWQTNPRPNADGYLIVRQSASVAVSAANWLCLTNPQINAVLFLGVDCLPGHFQVRQFSAPECPFIPRVVDAVKREGGGEARFEVYPEAQPNKDAAEAEWKAVVREMAAVGIEAFSIAPETQLAALPRLRVEEIA